MPKTERKSYRVIGLMSGTSLDGLDLAAATFSVSPSGWEFDLGPCQTISYSEEWLHRLKSAHDLSGFELSKLHTDYGRFLGQQTRKFCQDHKLQPELIGSHGHTVFHQPDLKLTLQIGDGAALAAEAGITTICDFRTGDVALGGQGAPLVPIGDHLLFGEYRYCLNLGGFANISFEKANQRLAFDICPANLALNHLANRNGLSYDKDGLLARSGQCIPKLLQALNGLEFYHQSGPKSLGREWLEEVFLPLIEPYSTEDSLNTVCEHIAQQIGNQLMGNARDRVLVTGGGAFNTFLLERLQDVTEVQISRPEKSLIEFKEALIFGFLAVLRFRREANCLSSVTGASRDHSGGAVFLP